MLNANWIRPVAFTAVSPVFQKKFRCTKKVQHAVLKASARGLYTAVINDKRVGDFMMAPGWTEYEHWIQLQEYDVTPLLTNENTLQITLSGGWYLGRIATGKGGFHEKCAVANWADRECAVIAELQLTYTDGTSESIGTDDSWLVGEGPLRYADIYDGEVYDATVPLVFHENAVIARHNKQDLLCKQVGEPVVENERIKPLRLIHTPKGETVLDFGQNMTGYIEFTVQAKAGDPVEISFAEILDKDGNFYHENYRTAKSQLLYTCANGLQTHKPQHTYFGFRYIRLDRFPTAVEPEQFTAIVLHSKMRQTGRIESSDPLLNQLFSNILWGQKSNYVDVPTDCPQRDERMGWTGDAQVFMRTASYNFDVRNFFAKWLRDVGFAQEENGAIPNIVPKTFPGCGGAAWGDAVTVCPWQLYLTYGDRTFLENNFSAMKKWVDYITHTTAKPNLWIGGKHYGDWLELSAKYGECKGATRDDLIATAFYAHSCRLLCKAGRVLGMDVTDYEALYQRIITAFRAEFKEQYHTQTEYILALHFGLTAQPEKTAADFIALLHRDGDKLQTGFVGTPYILHVLSDMGQVDLAYQLLLRRAYPSWLYPVTKGATTMWEHWDGIKPNGDIWPVSMNSYNHYAYGAVADWIYGVAAGIQTVEEKPGFEAILFRPAATRRLDRLFAEIDTVHGKVRSGWYHSGDRTVYEITTPVAAKAMIGSKIYNLTPGTYRFSEEK